MEKNVTIIPEAEYQKIKNELGKENEWFSRMEIEILTQWLGEIQANQSWKKVFFYAFWCTCKNGIISTAPREGMLWAIK